MTERRHASHCCRWHGCEYNDPDCPVVDELEPQTVSCGMAEPCSREEGHSARAPMPRRVLPRLTPPAAPPRLTYQAPEKSTTETPD